MFNAPQTKKSLAEELIQPAKLSFSDEPRKLYVGRIPKGASDEFIERIFRLCISTLDGT
jgi:RNA recognition motif-containing protein